MWRALSRALATGPVKQIRPSADLQSRRCRRRVPFLSSRSADLRNQRCRCRTAFSARGEGQKRASGELWGAPCRRADARSTSDCAEWAPRDGDHDVGSAWPARRPRFFADRECGARFLARFLPALKQSK
eukprot:7032621-Alexandrium_andersonii.AAC.1